MYRYQVSFFVHIRIGAEWSPESSLLTKPFSLAYAEVYLCLGLLLRRLGPKMSLYETSHDDVEIHYDRFVPTPKEGTEGIRVLIRE